MHYPLGTHNTQSNLGNKMRAIHCYQYTQKALISNAELTTNTYNFTIKMI